MKQARKSRTLTRRQFTLLSASSFTYLMASSAGVAMAFPRFRQFNQDLSCGRPPVLGTTFSQLQCYYMGLDYRETFKRICSLGLNRIRLCSYWHEIEPHENQFDFTALDWLLEESHNQGIEIVLTVGMKAPRWPEFHFPDWIKARYDTSSSKTPLDQRSPAIADRTLNLIRQVVNHSRNAPALKYWQVENEPFTRLDITGGRFLSYEFVRREVELVRSLLLPSQKLVLTNAISLPSANAAEDEQAFQESMALADAVGINVYSKVPAGNSFFYLQPSETYWERLSAWRDNLALNGREDWIAEAQAEPWEPNQLVAMGKANYPSSSPRQATILVNALSKLGYSTVMLWGCEYWYWSKKNGRNLWWWTMQQLVSATVNSTNQPV